MSFQPLVPLWLLIAAGILVVVASIASIWAARASGAVRALALAAMLIALAGPSLVREERDPVKDVVAVVVDKSASQRIGDRAAQTDQALTELKRRLAAMPQVETRVIEASPSDGGAEGTKLFGALQSGLADVPSNRVAGVVMLTDGIVHDIPGLEGYAVKAPLHGLITGREGERDRRIELVEAPKFGIVGKDQVIRARVHDTIAGGPARLVVKRDGTEIASLTAPLGQTMRIPVRIEHGGANVIELEVDPVAGELTELNNRAVITVEGVREKLRVLLVSGEPHAGERTWRNLLKSDANVELVHFTILRPPEKQDGTPINEFSLIAFPTRELFGDKIKEFDLIVFDRYANQSILPRVYFENIVRYVREGGAVMIAAGPEYAGSSSLAATPLAQVIPARPDGRVIERPYRARITDIGRRHPVSRDLPGGNTEPPSWSEWIRLISAKVEGGTAVMDGPDASPLMVLAREEKGRVAILLTDHAWLWARHYREGGPHLEMLRRVSHWLMKEPQLEEEALRGSARGQALTIERQTMADAAEPVTLTMPSGATRTLALTQREPGLFQATTQSDEIGLHKLNDGSLTAFIGVGPDNPRELRDVLSDPEPLRKLTEASGGSVRRVAAGEGDAIRIPNIVAMRSGTRYATADSIGIRLNDQSIVRGIAVWPVFAGLGGLLLIGSILLAAWLAEAGRFSKKQS